VHISLQLTELLQFFGQIYESERDLTLHAYNEKLQELTMALPKASAAWSLSSCISSVIKGAS
jgi:hypothetical protein